MTLLMTEAMPRLRFGDWVDRGLNWLRRNWDAFFDGISNGLRYLVDGLTGILTGPPAIAIIIIFVLLGWIFRSWKLAVSALISFLLIDAFGQWTQSMQTLSLVLVATLIALIIAIPLGILSAKSRTMAAIMKPILDFMQTMPAFVYLIPAVLFFSIGVVPGVIATIIFALPPGVRFTQLGIESVDSETIEAGKAFGSTRAQILRQIEWPLAVPTVMAGVNQVIMLALSMSVIAGMVGADGLGKEVTASISTLNTALGVEAGLAVVFLAIYLDRLTAALGNPTDYPTSLRALIAKRSERAAHIVSTTIVALISASLLLGIPFVNGRKSGVFGGRETITMAYIDGWTDQISFTYLLADQLEKRGYNVEIETLSDNAFIFSGLATGDIDLFGSAWPEVTHKAYMDRYRGQLDDLGIVYDGAKLTFAVPEYTDIDSIDDLVGQGSRFNNRVVGIEPGAGLTEVTKNSVFPEYGLNKEYSLVTSSTATMLAELRSATDKNEDIVVTLWRPFWANSAFPVKDLEDPKGALGEAESIHVLSRLDFASEHPKVAELAKNMKLDDEQFNALENLVSNRYSSGAYDKAVDEWIKDHPDAFEGLLVD